MIMMFEEFERHLMEDVKPSLYFKKIMNNQSIFTQYPYTLLKNLEDTPQSLQYHPEGNVWNHTLLVLDNASKVKGLSENPRAFMWI
jgi:tRNA nucleotidyltransferase (CCA-adding enzyme)